MVKHPFEQMALDHQRDVEVFRVCRAQLGALNIKLSIVTYQNARRSYRLQYLERIANMNIDRPQGRY